jgi:predicted nucleotidyltransferase
VIIPVFIEDIDYELAKIKEKLNQQVITLHIDENHKAIIVSIIRSIPELKNCTVYLYGSRVQGTAVKYSDVDIALDDNGKPVADAVRSSLSSLLEKSMLPYTVDIIDLNTVSPVFRAKIEKDFAKLV